MIYKVSVTSDFCSLAGRSAIVWLEASWEKILYKNFFFVFDLLL